MDYESTRTTTPETAKLFRRRFRGCTERERLIMIRDRRLVARYIIAAVLPYISLTLVLLTAVLFAQQATRFAELALFAPLSYSMLGEVAAALLPSVLVFTLPMSVL